MEALPSTIFQEIRQEFLAETEEMLEALEEQLRLVRSEDPRTRSVALNRIYRRMHSLKGSAGMFGFPKVSGLCHELEEFVERLIQLKQELDEREVGLLSEGLLVLRPTFAPRGEGGKGDPSEDLLPGEGPETLLRELRAYLGNETPAAPGQQPVHHHGKRPQADGVAKSPGKPAAAPTRRTLAPVVRPTSVRVNTRELERMIDLVGEIHLQSRRLLHQFQEGSAGGAARFRASDVVPIAKLQGRRLAELRRRLQALQMVPIRQVLTRFFPLAQTLAMRAGKEIRITATGEETRVDRALQQAVSEPLLHLVRNAVDHGLETPVERAKAGKPRAGNLRLSARSEGHHVTIEVVDDGRGVDREAVARRARELGLPLSTPPQDEELWSCLFHPGFTTRREVTELSGRGVGLDVVRRMVRELQGMVDLSSTPGKGTRFSLRIPQTLTVIRGLVAYQGNLLVAFPLHLVAGVHRNAARHYVRSLQGAAPQEVQQEASSIDLGELFDIPSIGADRQRSTVIVGIAERRLRVVVDHILRQEELVVRPLGPLLDGHPGLSGAVELADGRLALVLDIPFLVSCAGREPGRTATAAESAEVNTGG